MEKYTKIHTLGNKENDGILDEVVVCQSKVDGANFRCQYDDVNDTLVFGSHNRVLEDANPERWKAMRSYLKAFELHKDGFIPNVIYFSESMQQHTIAYDGIPDTIGFDVYDIEREEYYHWEAAKEAFERIGIPFIHIHFEKHGRDITVGELKRLWKESPYRKEGDEGVVLKCYSKKNIFGRPLFAKLVDPLFMEENMKAFKTVVPNKSTNDTEIVDRYFTDARFTKAIHHFMNDGIDINMSLMPKLFKYIGDDILSENILYITGEWKSINFKTFYNLIARKCAITLKEYLLLSSGLTHNDE